MEICQTIWLGNCQVSRALIEMNDAILFKYGFIVFTDEGVHGSCVLYLFCIFEVVFLN